MHARLFVWGSVVALLVPVIGMALCWGAWHRRPYADRHRRRAAQAGLILGTFAVLFAAMLPPFAMLPFHMQENLGDLLAGIGILTGVAAPLIAAVLLGFGYGLERWLGIACVLLALAADLAMLLGAA